MAELIPLGEFFRNNASRTREEFLAEYDGAFFLLRARDTPPQAVFLARKEGFKLTVGSDEDCDLEFELDQTLDPVHVIVSFHAGFRGWIVEDQDTSFGTHVGEERVTRGRAHLLQDRQVLKPGGGLIELQFYNSEALWKRMTKAGLTRKMKIPKRPPTN